MKFLIDAQLPPVLAQWLREAGHEAEHVDELGLRDANDAEIWAHALKTQAIIVTKDEDFAERSDQFSSGPVIVWLRIGNATNRRLHAWFGRALPAILQLLESGHHFVEVNE